MMTTETFIAAVGTTLLTAALLLAVAWIPWSVVALVYKTRFLSSRVRRRLTHVAVFITCVALMTLLQNPAHLHTIPPLATFVSHMLSDSSLDGLGTKGLAAVRSIVVVECVLAIVLPVVLLACYIAASFYELVVAPPLHLLLTIHGAIALKVQTRIRAATRRSDQRKRRAEAERLQQQERQAHALAEFQKEQDKRQMRRQGIARIVSALEELPSLPDFKRATLVAKEADQVTDSDRKELFRLYRPALVSHLADRLDARADQEDLLESLRKLLDELRVPGADFETSYMLTEAEAELPEPSVRFEREYRGKITELRRHHEIRICAVADLEDDETVERLVEIEREKLKAALIKMSMPEDDPIEQLDLSALEVEQENDENSPS